MGDGKTDELKGRMKEAGGDLTDDDELRREGKVDKATGRIKQRIDDASNSVKDKLGRDDD